MRSWGRLVSEVARARLGKPQLYEGGCFYPASPPELSKPWKKNTQGSRAPFIKPAATSEPNAPRNEPLEHLGSEPTHTARGPWSSALGCSKS